MFGERLEQRAPTVAVWREDGLGFAQVALEVMAVPSSNGCANGAGECIHSKP